MSTNPFRSIAPRRSEHPGKKRIVLRIVAAATGGLLVAAAYASPATAGQSPTALGSAASFSVLAAAAATVPGSTLPGDVGAVTAITDDADTVYGSPEHLVNDAATQQALADAGDTFTTLNGLAAVTLTKADLGGQTLVPGVYHSVAAYAATSTVTFDAQGDPSAYFIIQGDAALNTTASTSMVLVNGAQASNIFWVLKGAATLGASSTYVGTILTNGAVTVGASTHVAGRAISLKAAVTLDADVFGPVSGSSLGAAPAVTITGGSTATTNDSTPTITGTTDAPVGTVVSVAVGNTTLTTTVLTGGVWTVTLGTALPEGPVTVVASVTPAGSATGTATQILTIDTTAPAIAITGGSTASTNDSTPTITGTSDAPAGSTVTVSIGGTTVHTTVSLTGTWSVTSPALNDGVVVIIASVTDAAGNTGTATQSLTVDTAAPSLAITGGPKLTTKDSTPTISGTTDAAKGSIVTITVAGQTLTATVLTGGKWSATATVLAEGAANVVATVTDTNGNTATATQVLTVKLAAAVVHHLSTLVYFAGDSSAITQAARTRIAAIIKRVPSGALTIKVHITGYIKLLSPSTENKALANARTHKVYDLMKGKVSGTYTLKGVGKGLSYATNARRVEVVIYYTLPSRK
jgi:outer membrane protein OmpA-like peptidoglycan-associated protein